MDEREVEHAKSILLEEKRVPCEVIGMDPFCD